MDGTERPVDQREYAKRKLAQAEKVNRGVHDDRCYTGAGCKTGPRCSIRSSAPGMHRFRKVPFSQCMITDDNNNDNFINDAIITPAPVIANVSMRIGDRVD